MSLPSPYQYFLDYIARLNQSLESITPESLNSMLDLIYDTYRAGRTAIIAGNGGSSATASHMVVDLTQGIFKGQHDARPSRFKVICLSDNTPVVTATANDTSYEWIFAEQVKTYGEPEDLLIVISASGNSPNVIRAVEQAKQQGLKTIGLLGFSGGKCREMVDIAVVVDNYDYGPVEDIHMILDHYASEYLRQRIRSEKG